MRNLLKNLKITVPVPVIGIGCGVLGMQIHKTSFHLGKYASNLLKALEYRGYDSTGAIFQDDDKNTVLLKDVGAPSTLVETLDIINQKGKIFCGQVRWATFGQVSKENAQPHEVRCKTHIFGAHNGNITNTRELQSFLVREGHHVVSDNDGEMLVHIIEHYFEIELSKLSETDRMTSEIRRKSMRQAIINGSKQVIGSYAAVIVDPYSETSYAIKAGSSLYFGVGNIDEQDFCLASSDLTAVLKFTKNLVKLREGEFVEYTDNHYQVYAYKNQTIKKLNQPDLVYEAGQKVDSKAIRSKLRAEDTELLPEFKYFMEQEIYAEPEAVGKVIKLFLGGSNSSRHMIKFLENEGYLQLATERCNEILEESEYEMQLKKFNNFVNSEVVEQIVAQIKTKYPEIYHELVKEDFEKKFFFSSEMNTFIDLIGEEFNKKRMLIAKVFDSISENKDKDDFQEKVDQFLTLVKNTISNQRNIYTLACGTSYHATKTAALFFNDIAGVEIIPILPGEFRSQYSKSLKDNDVIIGVSQSGETKDLIDIFNDIDNLNLSIKKIVLVNNVNSTLGQEKSDVSIPIMCGPEIAVPATKSYMNQMTLFFYLAIRTAEMLLENAENNGISSNDVLEEKKEILRRYKQLQDLPQLLKETIETTDEPVEMLANKIYMEPSLHILATKISGIAMEGALKIRETVLNHTQGMEASEFKHGPNTILGKNTVFGMKNIEGMIKYFNKILVQVNQIALEKNIGIKETQDIIIAISDFIFNRTSPFNLSREGTKIFKDVIKKYDFFGPMYRNYPLIYITGPDTRDVNLTISQINTHKIRGADTFVIAEENESLYENASASPNSEKYYGWAYITLPKTGDSLMTCFSSTVVLQLLGLKMSQKKMEYLDKLNFIDHGVHPDVPKNVSKSITVD
ncbi:MAG: SIS domain-containing protein [Candidatus Cloacimonetes bacterium]|nr:SIS domain-containing protein [Candidatus Cloacimonadota bacterium]